MQNDAYKRGYQDAKKGRMPLFRTTRNGIIPTVDDDMSDNWDNDARASYLNGYELALATE